MSQDSPVAPPFEGLVDDDGENSDSGTRSSDGDEVSSSEVSSGSSNGDGVQEPSVDVVKTVSGPSPAVQVPAVQSTLPLEVDPPQTQDIVEPIPRPAQPLQIPTSSAPLANEPIKTDGMAEEDAEDEPLTTPLLLQTSTLPPRPSTPPPVVSREEVLRAQLAKRPRDGPAHLKLISILKQKGEVESVRAGYEALLKVFPLCASQWMEAITFEFAQGDTRKAEGLFARSLRTVLSIELWHLYLDYVRKTNVMTLGDDGPRKIIGKSYEFVLTHVGMDRNAGQIWHDYIAFLKSADARDKAEEDQKVETLRKVYHRALVLPLNNVEQIWRDYDQFENALNKAAAKKVLAEMSPSYMTARSAMRELRPIADSLPKLPIPVAPNSIEAGGEDFARWIALINWEIKNPLELEDPQALHQRVMFAAKQAFIWAYLAPNVWHHVAMYLIKTNLKDEAKQTLIDGFNANPESILLGFALAELYENAKELTEAYAVFQRLSDSVQNLLTMTQESIPTKQDADKITSSKDGSLATAETTLAKVKQDETEQKLVAQYAPVLTSLKESLSLITIQHLHTARRGESIKAARQVFSKARKFPYATWHVFHASAMMEYHNSKDPAVATKVFELGMKQFAQEAAYVERYLTFLLSINDTVNARALFERSLTEIIGEKTTGIWQIFVNHECNHGDLTTIQSLEQRMLQAFPTASDKAVFVRRHQYSGLGHIAELNFLGLNPASTVAPTKQEPAAAATSLKRSASEEVNTRGFSPVPPPRVARDADIVPPLSMPQLPAAKRARQGQGRNGVTPPQPPQRQASPMSRAVKVQQIPPPIRLPEEPLFAQVPEGILFFLSILPNSRTFNGPRLRTDDIVEAFRTLAPMPSMGHGYNARMYGR